MASLGLIGLVGGLGEGMVENAKTAEKRDFETWRMEILQGYKIAEENRAEGRTIAAENRKTAAADKARTDQVLRVDAKTGEIADAEVGRKRGLVEAGIADRSAWTPEHQAAVDQSLTLDREEIASDPETRIKAAAATGDLSLKDQATLHRDDRRLDAADRKTAAAERTAEMRDATQRYIAELRDKQQSARLEALIAKTGKDTDGVKEALSVIDGARKDLANDATILKSLYATELKDKSRSEQARIAAEYKAKFDSIDEQRRQLDADYDSLRSKVGLPPRQPLRGTPKDPPPAAQQPAGKPSAARPPLSSFLK